MGNEFSGMRVTVMGLGLNGGGLESARYAAARGAEVTVTDLRDEGVLAPAIEQLEASGFSFRYVLGRHEDADFRDADMVVKNPGVRPDSPFLALARRVETDISLFLASSPARILAVTGSKGKSGTASALHHVLDEARKTQGASSLPGRAWLGGNITVSPLSFAESLRAGDDVVLELSSWQLGDLRGRRGPEGGPLLSPRTALLTAIMPDHQDRYHSMEAYVDDKRIIYRGQDRSGATVAFDDEWGRSFLDGTPARALVNARGPVAAPGGWIDDGGAAFVRVLPGAAPAPALPETLLVPGFHIRRNLLSVAIALADLGLPPAFTAPSLGRWRGIEHRLEMFHEKNGVRFYNDSAATIPEAAAAALEAFSGPVALLTGGTDKDLDFSPLAAAIAAAWREGRLAPPVLFEGTGSLKLMDGLRAAGVPWQGPFSDTATAVRALTESATPGGTAIMSPGCASFGMFRNEFDRGNRFREEVRRLA